MESTFQPSSSLKTTPKDFFLQLGVMVALYVSVISLVNLLFQTINYAFPDKLAYYGDPYSTGIRLAIASLVIIFPLFLALSWINGREFARECEKRELPIRRWLVYLTLFVAGIAVVVDLIMLVNTFLSGEITTRFTLKVLTMLLVAGGVFGYFLYDLRHKEAVGRKDKIFAVGALIVVLGSIIWGFAIMGSPATARNRQFDDRRVSDLQNIQWQIINFWQQKEKIPASLSDMEDSISGWRAPVDPDTDAVYEYRRATDSLAFELCAVFSRNTIGERERLEGRGGFGGSYSANSISKPIYDAYGTQKIENWEHAKGRACFSRTIDPDLYPPTPRKQ